MRRIVYRILQFRNALNSLPDPEAVRRAKEFLSPSLFALFSDLLPFEQAHALRVFDRLQEKGFSHPDLLTAALVHDIGKARFPLRPWERVMGVLAKKFFPDRIKEWGQGQPKGLRLGIVVAEQHARWGAEMAEAAGASELIVRLVAYHQDQNFTHLPEDERVLLGALQSVDQVS
jgi:putative nucleotidyltransferase with HDIG domain